MGFEAADARQYLGEEILRNLGGKNEMFPKDKDVYLASPLLDSKRAFGFASQRLLTAGFTQGQGFDKGKAAAEEGTLLFDPGNPEHARTAIREARIRIRRQVSPKLLARLAAMRTARPTP